ncbi:TIGR02099 family protein [Colwellia chukchiensis]|uniref:TIGR02099 family protein n=1 Tax=Colwellia chukchiensis TaxID=641665 RepID=A0A1H7L9L2_9GAMM|nr:YhdP family protein [Colwellia chukchiensis]SEK95436.1 TIGR02099 family protein [Colwellia chukchiensis]
MSVSTVLNRWLKRLYKLLAILLVVFAVLISTLRLFLPYAHNYRQDVEDYLNGQYHSNISIGSLSMGWSKSGPTLITEQVKLLSSTDNKIYLDRLEVELDFWRSLQTGQIVTKDFVITGAELEFEQATLANSADEVKAPEDKSSNLIQTLSTILLEQISRFSIRDSHVLYHTATGVRAFTISEMFWLNADDRHQANGSVIVDGLSSNNLKLLLDFQGKSFKDLSGQAYLQANEIDITPWLGRVLAIKDAKTHSAINFNAWLTITSGHAEYIQLALGNNEITWQHLGQTQSFEINGGDIVIKAENQLAYTLATSPLTIKRNNAETNRLSLAMHTLGDTIEGYIDGLELASFEGISPLLLDNTALENLLLDLDATGRIEDIHFRVKPNQQAVTAKFNNVNSHFSHGIPGIDQVSGELIYLNNQLQIALTANDGALNFDKHFKFPIPYTHLSALVNARFSADAWQFSAENIALTSPQLQLNADLSVASNKAQAPSMALLASVKQGDAQFAEYFYPHLLMGEDLVNYLNGAIIKGDVEQALVLFNGPFNAFPFHQDEGVFVVDAELTNSRFKFDAQWPAIDHFAANLNFTNNSMRITGRAGLLSGIDVTGVIATIDDLADKQVLKVDANFNHLSPPLVSQLMAASPMQSTVGVTLEKAVVSGPIDGKFSLILPLNNPDAVLAKGFVDFKNNNLALQSPRLDFSNIQGRLSYENDLITATDLKLTWRDMPITVNVEAKQNSEQYRVNINTVGQWQPQLWQAQIPKVLRKYGQGALTWQGDLALNISAENFSYDYQINSTLNELALALPSPFSKLAGEPRLFNIHAFGDQSSSTITGDIGDNIDFYGSLDHQQAQFSLAHLVLGQQQLWLPTTGFHITADVAEANFEQWQPLIADILTALDEAETSQHNAQAATPSLLNAPNKIHGKLGQVNVYGEHIQQLDFSLSPQTDHWLLNVNAKELRGSANIYHDWHQQGIAINADFIHLAPPLNEDIRGAEPQTAEAQQSPETENNSEIDHRQNAEIFAFMPPLQVQCASCRYGHYDLGQVEFSLTRKDDNRLVMQDFVAQRGKNSLAFQGQWQLDELDSKTTLTGTLVTSDVAREVENLGYVSIIKDSGAKLSYDVQWQGGPHNFSTATFNGELAAAFDDGYLADVDDKGVRILSLLSLQSLVRKLSFDFRDIFSDGMFYRELTGSFTVKDGVAYTDNVLMKGTAGDLSIVGNTNLNNGDLDYRMSYKPNLTSSLPVLAWIATLNPVTFLAGVALDEVITSTVIAEINFEVTGNLADPQFKQVSRKNQNISVGRSSPPKIVETVPEGASLAKPITKQPPASIEQNLKANDNES